jgi:hypothetical protein
VKRFVSLQFFNPRQFVGLLDGGSGRRKAAIYTVRHKHRINANIHALSGIRTHDPSVRVGEDISCLRPRDQNYHLSVIEMLKCVCVCVYIYIYIYPRIVFICFGK